MSDEYPTRHHGPNNRDHIISGEASDEQLEIDLAVSDLSHVIENYVPTTTAHYAIEGLRAAIKRYYSAPPITTNDVQAARNVVDVSMRNGAGDLAPRS